MGLRFCSFASGSTGNSYLVRTDNTAVLVDCGISGKRIIEGLAGLSLDTRDLSAILITHEHSDHIQSIRMIARKAKSAGVYATRGTIHAITDKIPEERCTPVKRHDTFRVGDIEIRSFGLFHDASEPVGYSFTSGGRSLSIVTDTGIVTDSIFDSIKASNALILEANHEVNLLRVGPYPYELQQRILSDYGHLSNEAAGNLICRMLDERKSSPDQNPSGAQEAATPPDQNPSGAQARETSTEADDIPYVLLAHISRNNNTPDQALLTVKNILFENDYYIGKDVNIDTASFSEPGPEIEV